MSADRGTGHWHYELDKREPHRPSSLVNTWRVRSIRESGQRGSSRCCPHWEELALLGWWIGGGSFWQPCHIWTILRTGGDLQMANISRIVNFCYQSNKTYAHHHTPRSTTLSYIVQALKERLDMLEAWKNSTRDEGQMRATKKPLSFCFTFR